MPNAIKTTPAATPPHSNSLRMLILLLSASPRGRSGPGYAGRTSESTCLAGLAGTTRDVDSSASPGARLRGGSDTSSTGSRRARWAADTEFEFPHVSGAKLVPAREDVREFIRRLEAVRLTVDSTPGHYRVLRDGKPLRKQNGMPFTLPFSPDTNPLTQDSDRRTTQARNRPL